MSLAWDEEIHANRIYLPAQDDVANDVDGIPIEDEIRSYINREFPLPSNDENACYSVPKKFTQSGEQQACDAESIAHKRFCDLNSASKLWQVCFQGIAYAGRSKRNDRNGKIMSKEHDLVIFNIYEDRRFVTFVEVKSICDDSKTGYKTSDALSVKNNKRSGQHQLRDHVEILENICDISRDDLNCFLFWPFLTMWTVDPKGNRVKRWENEHQHVFSDTLKDQEKFDAWFRAAILGGKSIDKTNFDVLFQRFITLSCGIFVNEIHEGIMALLSQQQVSLLHLKSSREPTIVHGAAGTGKTFLVLHRLKYLHDKGLLDHENRALYICYWPGIRSDFKRRLEKLNIAQYVDTIRFFISRNDFLIHNRNKYRHIFMDESEAICLSFSEDIVISTFASIERCRKIEPCYGDLWYLVDINQATMFLPKYSPEILKRPNITLSKVIRNTGTIYKVFSEFYKNPLPLVPAAAKLSDFYLSNIDVGHDIKGPPIYWANVVENEQISAISNKTFNTLIKVIVDLYSTKGIKPNDLCILPFFITKAYLPDSINQAISDYFVTNGYRPNGITRVEEFISECDQNKFLIPWVLLVKGLEFRVVVIAIEQDDFDHVNHEDRRKLYVMASRCTCLLILVSTESVKDTIDTYKVMKNYPFGLKFDD